MKAEVDEAAVLVEKDEKARPEATLEQKIWREALSWFWVILAFLFIEGTLVQARVIPSGSMEKTVLIGDHLIVSRIGYDAGIPFTDFIKRCIGLPGDTLEIKRGVVYVNGKALDEPYRMDPPNPMENRGPIHVPAGEYFMMGDNRENSYDSRYWGFVPRANIIGTPVMIYMSIDAPEEVWEPGHVVERFTTYVNALIHPSEVRWKRLFHIF